MKLGRKTTPRGVVPETTTSEKPAGKRVPYYRPRQHPAPALFLLDTESKEGWIAAAVLSKRRTMTLTTWKSSPVRRDPTVTPAMPVAPSAGAHFLTLPDRS